MWPTCGSPSRVSHLDTPAVARLATAWAPAGMCVSLDDELSHIPRLLGSAFILTSASLLVRRHKTLLDWLLCAVHLAHRTQVD